jgi:hypothetical protein
MKRSANSNLRLWMAWAFVGIPALWGVLQTILKTLALFR